MEATTFLLGVCVGGMVMLLIILRLIANMHDRFEENMRRR